MGPIAHNIISAVTMVVGVISDPTMLKHEVVVTACCVILSYAFGETYKGWKRRRNSKKRKTKAISRRLVPQSV